MGVRANVGNAGSMGKTKTSSQTQASQPEWRAAWSAQTATYPVFPCWVKKIVIKSLPKGKSFLPRSYSWIYIYIYVICYIVGRATSREEFLSWNAV